MREDAIYTPRFFIDMTLKNPNQRNKATCTKIPYQGYDISIAMDSSHGDGDLFRSDIRIFDPSGEDVGKILMPEYESDIYATGEALKAAFAAIDKAISAQTTA